MRAGAFPAALLLAALAYSPAKAADEPKPATVQTEFKRWTAELETLLQGQPKSSELRQNLRIWFTDQGRSLSKVKEPLLSASLPSKMWGSAAFVVDSANQNFTVLSAQEFRALLDFSNRVLEYCHSAYGPRQTVCTDDHYWELKAKNALYRAQLGEADAVTLLAGIPAMVTASFQPLSGAFAPSDLSEIATDRCSGWYRLWTKHLMPEYNKVPERLQQSAYLEAYIGAAADTLALCQAAKADGPSLVLRFADLGIATLSASPINGSPAVMGKAYGLAATAYDELLIGKDSYGSDTLGRSNYQLKLLLLAKGLGKQDQAKAWADALPKALTEESARSDDGFNCRYFTSETEKHPLPWQSVQEAFPQQYQKMVSACPSLAAH